MEFGFPKSAGFQRGRGIMIGDYPSDITVRRLAAPRAWIARVLVLLALGVVIASLPATFGLNLHGRAVPTWAFIGVFTLMFPPVFVPLWLSVLLMAGAAMLGTCRIIWVARVLSLLVGAMTIWLVAGYNEAARYPGAYILAAGILLDAIATWIVPTRRRRTVEQDPK